MSSVMPSFSAEIKSFINDHKLLCVLSLGTAVIAFSLGKLIGRTITWIQEARGSAKKVEILSQTIKNSSNSPIHQDNKSTLKTSRFTSSSSTLTPTDISSTKESVNDVIQSSSSPVNSPQISQVSLPIFSANSSSEFLQSLQTEEEPVIENLDVNEAPIDPKTEQVEEAIHLDSSSIKEPVTEKTATTSLHSKVEQLKNRLILAIRQREKSSFNPPKKISKGARPYPPDSIIDTQEANNKNKSIHGTGNVFSDREIIKVNTIINRKTIYRVPNVDKTMIEIIEFNEEYYNRISTSKQTLDRWLSLDTPALLNEVCGGEEEPGIYAYYTENNRPIIQQQSTRGCTAAATAMLIMNKGKAVDIQALLSRNLGNDSHMLEDIKDAGLTPVTVKISNSNELQAALKERGSAIVSINSAIGSHVVVLDSLTNEEVLLRDPYHGWEVVVDSKSFFKQAFNGNKTITLIQIEPTTAKSNEQS